MNEFPPFVGRKRGKTRFQNCNKLFLVIQISFLYQIGHIAHKSLPFLYQGSHINHSAGRQLIIFTGGPSVDSWRYVVQ